MLVYILFNVVFHRPDVGSSSDIEKVIDVLLQWGPQWEIFQTGWWFQPL